MAALPSTAPSQSPPDWDGDAKVAGIALEVDDDEAKRALLVAGGNEGLDEDFHLFRADIREVVVVSRTTSGPRW